MADDPHSEAVHLLERYVATLRTRSTKTSYTRDVKRFLAWCEKRSLDPLSLTEENAWRFRSYLEGRDLKLTTLGRYQSAVAGFYNFLVDQRLLDRSPFERIPTVKARSKDPIRRLDRPQLRAVLSAARDYSAADYAVVALLGVNGLRAGELCAARIEDVRTENDQLVLHVGGPWPRVTPVRRDVAAALAEHWAGRTHGPLLHNQAGRALTVENAQGAVSRAARTAGVTMRVTAQVLRDTAMSIALSSEGMTLQQVTTAFGVKTMERFARLMPPATSAFANHPVHVVGAALTSEAEPTADLLDQIDRFLADPGIHLAAPVVLAGAVLEQFLRKEVERHALPPISDPSLEKFANELRRHRLISRQQRKDIAAWTERRNQAAHGRFGGLDRDDARAMAAGIRTLVSKELAEGDY